MSDPVTVSIILSDLVICEQGTGKNSLIGVFNNFNVPQIPFPTPLFFITVALTNMPATPRTFNIAVRIEDPSTGHVLKSVGGEIKFRDSSNLSKEFVFEVSIPVTPFFIPKPGHYEVKVFVNNSDAGKRLLTVNSMTATESPPQ